MKKERLSVSFDTNTMNAIKKEASIRNVSIGQIVRDMVKKSING